MKSARKPSEITHIFLGISNLSYILRRSAYKTILVLFSLIILSYEMAVAAPKETAIKLPKNLRGKSAIAALGDSLPKIARQYGMSARELKLIFKKDKHLILDKNAKLLYDEPVVSSSEDSAKDFAAQEAPYPLTETFKLHSLPGATKRIYLDFDGHTTSGTSWNTNFNGGANFTTPAYDIDGNTANFSPTELERIQNIWRRVVEDFAPWQFDVTTEDPGAAALSKSGTSDTEWGIRVVIGGSSTDWYGNSAGGVAYIGSFTSSVDTPVFVFENQLGNGNEKYVAEAVSHEVGHALGLAHDGLTSGLGYYQGHGSGATGWAPIMGVGYYTELTQWSRGEYLNANNTQDDTTIIQSYSALHLDDHGNTLSTATLLSGAASFTATGLISTRTDVDLFRFASPGGTVAIVLESVDPVSNLDLQLELLNTSGQVLALTNPLDLRNASLSSTLAAGDYYIRVDGVGKGDPLGTGYTDYGSLGRYKVSVSQSSTGNFAPVAVISTSAVQGNAPLTVSFSASGSYDVDGTISSYQWDFGNGTTGIGSTATAVYSSAGTYTARLKVVDNNGLEGNASVQIQVTTPNMPPIADLTATPSSGIAPVLVVFDGSSSSDPDGSITSYFWEFGNGITATTTQPTVQHSYANGGNFTARLTVTDNRGATSSKTILITVQTNPSLVMKVSSISLSVVSSGNRKSVRALVKVVRQDGAAVSGAKVTGSFSGVVNGTVRGTTDSSGNVILTSKFSNKSGKVLFTILNVELTGSEYNPGLNTVSNASVTF